MCLCEEDAVLACRLLVVDQLVALVSYAFKLVYFTVQDSFDG